MKVYEAIIIDPLLPNGRSTGTLTIQHNSVVLSAGEKKYTILFDQLEVTLGGAANSLVFFNNTRDTTYSIYTSDKKILNDPLLHGHPTLKIHVKKARNTKRILRITTFSIILLILGFFASLFFAKDYIVEKIARQVPVEWEKKAGDELFKTLSGRYRIIENDSLKRVFLSVAEPLLNEIKKENIAIDLYFIDDPSINAFALPGGKVIIQTGLIENAKSWEEVMGVLSHELSHVTRRHHLRGIINNLGIYALISALVGDMSAIAATITNMGGELSSLSNSRYFETEADETGFNYLIHANINPKGMISFFQTLEKKHGSKSDDLLAFMSTHPATKERIAGLTKKLNNLHQRFHPLPTTFNSFKKSLNSNL